MTALLWQTALLLLAAYFLGAWLGCMIRRTFFAAFARVRSDDIQHSPANLAVSPLAASAPVRVPAAPTTDTSGQFDRALAGEGLVTGPGPTAPVGPPVQGSTTAPAPAGAVPPAPPPPAAHRPGPRAPTAAAIAVAVAPRATATPRSAAGTSAPPAHGQRITMPAAAKSAGPGPADVSAAGVTTRPAAATATRPTASPVAAPAPVSSKGAVQTPAAPAPAVSPIIQPPTTQPADDLTRIQGIDPGLQVRLHALGVRRFADIAGWRAADLTRISAALAFKGRIERENWIEQAQVLANGRETYFSSRKRGGELTNATGAPPPDEGTSPAPRGASPTTAMKAAAPAASAAPPPSLAPAAASGVAATPDPAAATALRAPATGLGRDNLQRIHQITAEVEKQLNVQGVSRYEQIAAWGSADVARFDRLLGQPGRITRENWIDQAQILARRDETTYSREFDRRAAERAGEPPRPTRLADAIRSVAGKSESDGALATRAAQASIQSEASRGSRTADAGATTVAPQGAPAPGAGRAPRRDDLKRIRGVGVLIETKLNAMGITSYEQIANWSQPQIDRVSQLLDLKVRIEREKWVEQARTLSTGGQTEFSQRIDRGEIEASRNKT